MRLLIDQLRPRHDVESSFVVSKLLVRKEDDQHFLLQAISTNKNSQTPRLRYEYFALHTNLSLPVAHTERHIDRVFHIIRLCSHGYYSRRRHID